MNTNGSNQNGRTYKMLPIYFMVIVVVCLHVVKSERTIDCRKYVHAPICRGIAAKRDINSHTDNVRDRDTIDNEYYSELDKGAKENIIVMKNLLIEILGRNPNRNPDYDSNTGQTFSP